MENEGVSDWEDDTGGVSDWENSTDGVTDWETSKDSSESAEGGSSEDETSGDTDAEEKKTVQQPRQKKKMEKKINPCRPNKLSPRSRHRKNKLKKHVYTYESTRQRWCTGLTPRATSSWT